MNNLIFKTLSNKKEIELIDYIKNYLIMYPDTTIFIGTDSQNQRTYTNYASVIVLHNKTRGGHVIYTKRQLPKIYDKFVRLWNEIEFSLEIADYLVANNVKKPDYIDLDLNPDPKYKSNDVLRAALGYVIGLGYNARCKPNAMSASYVADTLCK